MVRKIGAVLEVILSVTLYEDAQFPGSRNKKHPKSCFYSRYRYLLGMEGFLRAQASHTWDLFIEIGMAQ